MIPLMKSAFLNEFETKQALIKFIEKTNRFSMGQECSKFEKNFSNFTDTQHGLLFNSGGSANLALIQALLNLGRLKPGDKVGCSALTWSTNIMPLIQLGLEPVPIDCNPSTLNTMSTDMKVHPDLKKLKAFFITNALGLAGDLHQIKALCKENNIILIEDNCEALGTELDGKKTGTFGIAGTHSFFVAHHMSTIEGGMIVTNDSELANMLIMVRANGWDRNLKPSEQNKLRKEYNIAGEFEAKYTFYDLAYNVRPTEITGFLGNWQMQYLKDNINRREEVFKTLCDASSNNKELKCLDYSHLSKISAFAFPILCKTNKFREKYFRKFAGEGVEIRPMIAGNMQNQPFFNKYVKKHYKLQGADFLHNCSFYCGNYPELEEADIYRLMSCLSAD